MESCALLNKKLGKYFDSVKQYITVMETEINLEVLKKELNYAYIHRLNSAY